MAHAWSHLGISAQIIRTRGDSADVLGKTDTYSIVGDAKAFRLSRTAKNQKDFKIRSLDDWRKTHAYASLVGPLYQYPKRISQIYRQSVERNVTLLSYTHLRFMIDHFQGQDFAPLWSVAGSLPNTKEAAAYWGAIDRTVCDLLGLPTGALHEYKQETIAKAKELAAEGVVFWNGIIEQYRQMSQREAVARLIKAEKIEAKKRMIQRAVENPLPES